MNGECVVGARTSRKVECLMTLREAAAYLRLAEQTVRRHCLAGTIPHLRVFRRIRFRRAELDAWLDELADRALRRALEGTGVISTRGRRGKARA